MHALGTAFEYHYLCYMTNTLPIYLPDFAHNAAHEQV